MSRSASAATVPRRTRRRAPRRRSVEVGLDDKRAQWPAVLSGGQKQRVALARALVSHPRVLAFDEPLGALDALTRISMQRLLERVWREQAFTAILVTHDVSEAVALADRVLVIEDGRIAHDVTVSISRGRAGAARPISPRWKARSCASAADPQMTHQSGEAPMNSIVRAIRIDRRGFLDGFPQRHASHLTGGVSVITVGRGRDITGMTVTSVSSLSVDPPSLIVSVNRSSSSWPLLEQYGFFGVNILTSPTSSTSPNDLPARMD